MADKKQFGRGCKYSYKEVMLMFKTFQELDKSGDGKISIKELNTQLPKVDHSREQLNERTIIRSLDKDKDGLVTFDEMLQSLYPKATQKELKIMYHWAYPIKEEAVETGFKLSEEQRKELEEMFRIYDKDSSGGLDYNELIVMAKKTGYDDDEVEQLFKMSDKNKDAKIDLEEFVEMMQSMYM